MCEKNGNLMNRVKPKTKQFLEHIIRDSITSSPCVKIAKSLTVVFFRFRFF